ncbi:MAG: M67 family metallopeptidase [Oscillospiraceae bacterium]|nr:M67 family metallopeptidase [Oscillospiraceae bacterium]
MRLSGANAKKLIEHALRELPNEACGLLAGTEENGIRDIKEVYLLRNTDASPEHFSLDPMEQLAAIRDMREKGLNPLGNWHSHPETPSRPSEEDIRLAYDPAATYMILSLESETVPNLNAFRIRNGEAEWEILELYD